MTPTSAAAALAPHTYLPEDDQTVLAAVSSFLRAHEARHGTRPDAAYALVGVNEHDRVELTPTVHQVLLQVVEALRSGRAVAITPQMLALTSQQVADLLGVSRPTVVRLMDSGELAGERIGYRRRFLLTDVLDYRSARRRRQYEALAATAADEDEDPHEVMSRLRAARREAAAANSA